MSLQDLQLHQLPHARLLQVARPRPLPPGPHPHSDQLLCPSPGVTPATPRTGTPFASTASRSATRATTWSLYGMTGKRPRPRPRPLWLTVSAPPSSSPQVLLRLWRGDAVQPVHAGRRAHARHGHSVRLGSAHRVQHAAAQLRAAAQHPRSSHTPAHTPADTHTPAATRTQKDYCWGGGGETSPRTLPPPACCHGNQPGEDAGLLPWTNVSTRGRS